MLKKPSITTTYEVSWVSFLRIIIVAAFIYLLFAVSNVLMLLLTTLILSVSLSPVVDRLRGKLRIPRIIAIILIYIIIFAVIAVTVYTIVPPTIEQFSNLYHSLPDYGKKALPFLQSVGSSTSSNGATQGGASNSISGFFDSLFDIGFVLILTFILLIKKDGIIKYLTLLLPIKEKTYAIEVSRKIAHKIGAWFSGQILIMVIIGLINFFTFWALGIPYALTLGVLAFIFEAVPNIGPIIAAFPAIVLAYIDAPWKAVFVTIFAVALHLLSNQFLVPKVMGKILDISAFVIILGLIIGGELAGITGMIIALPVIAAIQVVSQEWPNIKAREGYRWKKKEQS